MSLVPALEIGVWNTWIFMAAWVFFHMAPLDWPIFKSDIKAVQCIDFCNLKRLPKGS
jgi:hypothetical protein